MSKESILILVGGIILLMIIILFGLENNFKKKFLVLKRDIVYKIRIKRLKNSGDDEVEKINKINEIARDFFKEFFYFDYKLDYSELIKEFKKLEKPKMIQFCQEMLSLYYSPEHVTKEKVDVLIEILEKIIAETKNINVQLKKLKEERIEKSYIPYEEIKHEEMVDSIENMINIGREYLGKNEMSKVNKIYMEIMKKYKDYCIKNEPFKKDNEIYSKIINFYNQIIKNNKLGESSELEVSKEPVYEKEDYRENQ